MEEKTQKSNKFKYVLSFIYFFIRNSFPFFKFYTFLNNLKIAHNISPIENYKIIRMKNLVYMWMCTLPYFYFIYKSIDIFLLFNNKILSKMSNFSISFDNILILMKLVSPFLLAFLFVFSITMAMSLIINFIVMKTHIKIIEERKIKDLLIKNKFIQKEEESSFFVFYSYEGIYLGHENYSQDDILSWKKFWEKLNFKIGKIKLSSENSNLSFYEKKYNLKKFITYVFN